VLQELGQVMFNLRSAPLPEQGLRASLADCLQDLASLGLRVEVQLDDVLSKVGGLTALFTHRIVSECLHNIRRHASAQSVRGHVLVQDNNVHGDIADDGRGFDVLSVTSRPGAARHFGLQGMKERAELLGGWLDVASQPGVGTEIRFRLPLGSPPAQR
jgi:signal transduction histidine kinase